MRVLGLRGIMDGKIDLRRACLRGIGLLTLIFLGGKDILVVIGTVF